MLGLLAIEDYQMLLGRGTAHLLLNGQNDFFDLAGIDALEQTTKGRLCVPYETQPNPAVEVVENLTPIGVIPTHESQVCR